MSMKKVLFFIVAIIIVCEKNIIYDVANKLKRINISVIFRESARRVA